MALRYTELKSFPNFPLIWNIEIVLVYFICILQKVNDTVRTVTSTTRGKT